MHAHTARWRQQKPDSASEDIKQQSINQHGKIKYHLLVSNNAFCHKTWSSQWMIILYSRCMDRPGCQCWTTPNQIRVVWGASGWQCHHWLRLEPIPGAVTAVLTTTVLTGIIQFFKVVKFIMVVKIMKELSFNLRCKDTHGWIGGHEYSKSTIIIYFISQVH